MVSLNKTTTERTVETRLARPEFALLVSAASTGRSLVVPYQPESPTRHITAITDALAVLAAEGIDPAGCVFDVLRCKQLDGKPYWAEAATLSYPEALDVLAGRRAVLVAAPDQGQQSPTADTPIGYGLTVGTANLCRPGKCKRCDGTRRNLDS